MYRNTRNLNVLFGFFLLLLLFTACQSDSTKDEGVKIDLEKLLGKWQSLENPKTTIELTTNRMLSYYDGLKLADEALTIYHACASRCVPEGVAPMPCLVTDGKMAENCFEVLELTNKKLSYTLIGQQEKVLSFQKL
ncbi:MAG: hypothetical protein AAF960_25990 [Bacteroidota bacterium]